MIADLLPAGIASAELFADPPGLVPHPLEESMIARAVEKRRREFVTARHCARIAMGQLGIEPAAVLRGERNMPVFPKGVVGSLTHCTGYRGAALGFSMQVRSIGIDAEPHEPLPEGVLDHVSIPAEREWLADRERREQVGTDGNEIHWDKLLFCAKEATYKAWFPLTGRWLGFEDAHITFTPDGRFRTELLVSGETTDGGTPLTGFDGRWVVDNGLVLTSIVTV